MNSLENWANFPGCQSICASRGKSSENLPVEKKYLEKISLIEKVATFVKEFFSKNGRTWSEINKIDFKINKRTFSSISQDDLKKLKKNLNSWTLSHIDQQIINNRIKNIEKFPLLRPNSDTQNYLINVGAMPGRPRNNPQSPFQVDDEFFMRKKEIATTQTKRWNLGFLAKNSDRQENHLSGLTKEAREDFANEIFQHATAPLKTPSTVNAVNFCANIDDLLSFQERGRGKYTGEQQFDNDLERLNKFIDNEKLKGEQAKETLRKSLAEILPQHPQDLFDRTLNIFSQTIAGIIPIASSSFIEWPEILQDPEEEHFVSVNLISKEQRIEFKSSHPIVNTKELDISFNPIKKGQLDVVISIPLDPTKVANFTLTRS
jgi:hypothetical protein